MKRKARTAWSGELVRAGRLDDVQATPREGAASDRPAGRRLGPGLAFATAGSGLASLVAVALLAPVDAAQGQDPPTAQELAQDCPLDADAVAAQPGEDADECPQDADDADGSAAAPEDTETQDVTPTTTTEDPPVTPDPDVPPAAEQTFTDPAPEPQYGDGGQGGDEPTGDDDGRAGPGGADGRGGNDVHNQAQDAAGQEPGASRDGEDHGGPAARAAGHHAKADASGPASSGGIAGLGSAPTLGTVAPATDPMAVPSFLVPLYRECGDRYGVQWEVLAAINQVETAFGSNLGVSSAGAVGWMQFLPSTWRTYGVDADGDGTRDPYDPQDAICAAASYLKAAGAQRDLRGAIFAYNHADWYVDMVLDLARQYAQVGFADPIPPADRLDRGFARELLSIARGRDVDWAVMLAILRTRGETGPAPADAGELRRVADSLAKAERAIGLNRLRRLVSRTVAQPGLQREAVVLSRFNRAVGIQALVNGLGSAQDALARRVLQSDEISVYPGGREDIAAGRIDPRVLALLLCLAQTHESIEVTSLISGHGYFARPGVPSAHVFGRAVDIAAIDGTPILGNQQPGGVTEHAVREILRLPSELRPAQVISLLDLGGPSFALADHDDHIHVGY